jgi:hypothetical protein
MNHADKYMGMHADHFENDEWIHAESDWDVYGMLNVYSLVMVWIDEDKVVAVDEPIDAEIARKYYGVG